MTLPACVSGHLDRDRLDGLAPLSVDLAEHDLRPADAELVPLAAHVLDQDAEVQDAAAEDLEDVFPVRLLHAERDVAEQLALEAVADLAARHELARLARERRRR